MNLIKQIILSFIFILALIVTGLAINLNRLFVLTATHHNIENEWEELQHAITFQDAIDGLLYDISAAKNTDSGDFAAIQEKFKAVQISFANIKLCSIELLGADQKEHQEAEDHLEQEEEKTEEIKEKIKEFLAIINGLDFSSKDFFLHKREILQRLSEKLFEIKIINLELRKVYTDGVMSALKVAKEVNQQVEAQIVVLSLLMIIIVAFASVLIILMLRERTVESIRSAKNETVGLLAKSFAHEIRNPLSIIKSAVSVVSREPEIKPGAQELLTYISEEVERIDGLVEQLQTLEKSNVTQKNVEDVALFVKQCVTLMAGEIKRRNVAIEYEQGKEPLELLCNRDQIKQLLINLLLNAFQASKPNSKIIINARKLSDKIELSVQDFGSGIKSEHIDNIFDPFYSTKNEGSGLGLAVAKNIVDNHGGVIDVRSSVQGTTFRIFLRSDVK